MAKIYPQPLTEDDINELADEVTRRLKHPEFKHEGPDDTLRFVLIDHHLSGDEFAAVKLRVHENLLERKTGRAIRQLSGGVNIVSPERAGLIDRVIALAHR